MSKIELRACSGRGMSGVRVGMTWFGKWFGNRKIAGKLFLGFAALLALNATVGIFCLQKLSVEHGAERDLAQHQILSLQALTDLRLSVNAYRHAQVEYLMTRTDLERRESAMRLREISEGIQSAKEKYGSCISGTEEERTFDRMKEDLDRYLAVSQEAIDLSRLSQHTARRRSKSNRQPADMLFGEETSAFRKALFDLQTAAASHLRLAEKAKQGNAALYASTRQQVELGIALSAAIGLVLALGIGRIVTQPLHQALAAARRIAAGDLSVEGVAGNSRDETGEFSRYMNEIQNTLREMTQSLADSARRITSASEPISAASTRQAQGASLQHEQALQWAAAAQEKAAAAKEISHQSKRAAETARQAAETASQGGAAVDAMLSQIRAITTAVGQTSKRIQELGKSSEQIGQIISVIDDIASQTNLLALNAAIEAARAGEQGRGFAVVAGEVTKLAERTTRATKEIELTIGQIQTETKNAVAAMSDATGQAEAGVEATRLAGELLRNSIVAAQELGRMVEQIAAATEQVGSNDHIPVSLDRMSNIAKESAEDALRSASAVSQLSELVLELRNLVNRPAARRDSQNCGNQNCGDPDEQTYRTAALRSRAGAAHNGNREGGPATNGLALAARAVPRPGVARLNARLLDAGTKPESPLRAPSSVSAGKLG